jgi:hypothetical protein
MYKKLLLVIIIITSLSRPGFAWVYPEHRDIMIVAIHRLDSAHRAELTRLWNLARVGFESRLDTMLSDSLQGIKPQYLDYAAWPAIAGDHSTSADNMLSNILYTDWILNVADVAAQLKMGLATARNRSERVNRLRDSDLRLLRVDPEYVSRAGSNNVHFMLARPDVSTSPSDYFKHCFEEGSEVNLISAYTWYHTSAMLKAQELASETLTREERSAIALAVLADEAFALHFLEDAFSAGHVAGIWGNAALRKGTHDYYDEHGLEVTTWAGDRAVLMGDAYLRPVDAKRAAESVCLSLIQVLNAAYGKDDKIYASDRQGMFAADTFNVAKAATTPARKVDPQIIPLYSNVLGTTPVPGLATGLGEIPRFRAEIGPFIGIQPGVNVSGIMGGFSPGQDNFGVIPGLEIAVHVGLGMEDVLNESGDGLVFLDLGWKLDGASSVKIFADPSYKYFGSILSAVPSRQAFYFRLRMPYYVIPGDLLLVAPFLYLFAPKAMNKMITTAGQGGLIPWQTAIITSVGRFQFILGREVGVYFYGLIQGSDSFLAPYDVSGDEQLILYTMRSVSLQVPLVEYRPFRTFSRRQSASFLFQLYGGVDIPGKATILYEPEAVPLNLKPIWLFGIRMAFDWRFYYARKKS